MEKRVTRGSVVVRYLWNGWLEVKTINLLHAKTAESRLLQCVPRCVSLLFYVADVPVQTNRSTASFEDQVSPHRKAMLRHNPT